METFRQKIINEYYDRLSSITIDDGFETDLGYNVSRGYVDISNSLEALDSGIALILEDSEEVVSHTMRGSMVKVRLSINIDVFYQRPGEHTNDMGRLFIGDVLKAMFQNSSIEIVASGVKSLNHVKYLGSSIGTAELGYQEANIIPVRILTEIEYVMDLQQPFF